MPRVLRWPDCILIAAITCMTAHFARKHWNINLRTLYSKWSADCKKDAIKPQSLMQSAFIFSSISTVPPKSVGPSSHPCRSETQYGNEMRYLRKFIHASLSTLEQSGNAARRRDDDFGGLKVA